MTDLAAIRERHVDTLDCGFPIHEDGTSKRPAFDGFCGYARRDAVHDLYPDVSQRDRLPTLMTEANRHAFVPGEPRGICEACRDDWPCDAAKLLALLADTPSVEPRVCGCPATDANGFARTCTLPLDHAGMHSARDTAGTPTGEATWLWNGPHGLAYQESKQP